MRTHLLRVLAVAIAVEALPLMLVYAQTKEEKPATKPEAAKVEEFKPEQQASKGSVTVGGNVINYDAFAGTLVVHTKDWDDVPQNRDKDDRRARLPPACSTWRTSNRAATVPSAP